MRAVSRPNYESASGIVITTTLRLRALLAATAVCAVYSATAFAQDAAATGDMHMNVAASAQSADPSTTRSGDPPRRHRHHVVADTDDRIDRLEREIEELKAQIANQPSSQVSSAQFEALQNQVYETQAMAKAAAAAPAAHQDKKIHFKGITFTFGGFLAAESVWRSNNLQSDIGSPGFSGIPFPGPGAGNSQAVGATATSAGVGNAVNIGHTREFRFSARQSRVSGMAEGDTGDVHLTGYGEFDFLGAAASANSNESNSFTPRVRNVYLTVDWTDMGFRFLAGQNWSLATLDGKGINERSELPPPTIDAQYVPGFIWTRQPQLRITKSFGDDYTLGLSVENPQTTLGGTAPTDCSVKAGAATQACTANGTVVISSNGSSFSGAGLNSTRDAEFNPGIQLSLNHVPDVIGKFAWEPGYFDGNVHLELFGIYRDFYDRTMAIAPAGVPCTSTYANCYGALQLGTARNHNVSGGGGGIAGLVKVIPGLFDVQFDAMYGTGIGRYGSGQLPDATYRADGTLQPLNEDMEMFGLTFHATPAFDLYVFGGREHEVSNWFRLNGSNGGYGNPNFVNTGCFNFNSTAACTGNVQTVEQITIGFWDKIYNGDYGSFRFGLQYSYTYLRAFDGVGGTPHTNDNMVFTSFRYYPF